MHCQLRKASRPAPADELDEEEEEDEWEDESDADDELAEDDEIEDEEVADEDEEETEEEENDSDEETELWDSDEDDSAPFDDGEDDEDDGQSEDRDVNEPPPCLTKTNPQGASNVIPPSWRPVDKDPRSRTHVRGSANGASRELTPLPGRPMLELFDLGYDLYKA